MAGGFFTQCQSANQELIQNIHSRWADVGRREQFVVQYLAHGHFDMQTGTVGEKTQAV